MRFEHVYLKIEGQTFYDYTLYTDQPINEGFRVVPSAKIKPTLIANWEAVKELENLQYSGQIVPSKGSSLYVSPGCSYATKDIRRNYVIKRQYDTGDYNVICAPKLYKNWSDRTWISSEFCLVSPLKKAIIAFKNQPSFISKELFPDSELDPDMLSFGANIDFQFFDIPIVYKAILDGTIKKPIIPEVNLDMSSELEMTTDILMLIYHSANNINSSWNDRRENTILQLKSLNQHNWRECKGTVSLLLRILNDGGVVSDILRHKSGLPKEVKNILSVSWQPGGIFVPVSEKDFYLGQKFIKDLLDIAEPQFCSLVDIYNKAKKYNISVGHLQKLFNCVVRIVPNKYETS